MVYRKGELFPAGVDRGWPYQVALPEDKCGYKNFEIHAAFNRGLSLCSRGHSVNYQGVWYRVFCYEQKPDAEAFLARFGGEWFDPQPKGKGANWMHYKGKLTGQPAVLGKARKRPIHSGADCKEEQGKSGCLTDADAKRQPWLGSRHIHV